jgi:non-ribosomal peptide synthetase component E (peptide arylation enzyme)
MSTSRWGERLVQYPADLADRYRQAGLWGTRTIPDELHAVAAAHPQRDAVVALDGRLTYRELDERTDVLAAGLAGLGLAPGDPVLFQVTNRLGAVLAWYGVLKAGLVPVCTLAAHRGHEISEISRRVGAVAHLVEAGTPSIDLVSFAAEQQRDHPTLRHVLVLGGTGGTAGTAIESLGAGTDPQTARKTVEEIQRGIDPDDVAVFQLSGGTTGVPKVIPRLHAEYWYNAAAYARSWGWSPDTRVAHLIPIIHNAGIVCAVHGPHSTGACLVLGTADLDVSLPLMARERATHVLLGHGHFKAIAEDAGFAAATASVTQVILSGTKVPPALFDDLERRGLWSGQLFGMGEGLFLTTRPGAPREARATTVGTPLSPMDEIRILAPGTGTELPDGEVGELCCRGPYTLRGYQDAAAHTPRPSRRRLLPHRRPRLGPRDRRPAVRRHRGPHQGPHQPGRREDQRRGGRAAAAPPPADHRGRRRRHAGPAARGTHLRLRRGTGRTAHHGRGPAALRRAAGGEVQMARTRRASRRSPPHPGREDG